jgi:hypothetical protein
MKGGKGKPMSNMISSIQNEKGSVIVVALIILTLLTILGISSMNTSHIEMRIATNSQDNQLDFYVADSGWKDAAMYLETLAAAPAWKNGGDFLVKNFSWNAGVNDITYTEAAPAPDFNALNPDSTTPPDNIDNDNDGAEDETGETAFNSRYNIQYFYQIDEPQGIPQALKKVAGTGTAYQRYFFDINSIAKRAHLDSPTAQVVVRVSKIYPTKY